MFFIFLNILGMLLMFLDKQFAIKKMRRIPEKVLITISFAGASIGILFGMFAFRHKTKKTKFQIFVPLSVIFNIIMFLLLI